MKPELFVKINLPHAKAVEVTTGIDAVATLTRAIPEYFRVIVLNLATK